MAQEQFEPYNYFTLADYGWRIDTSNDNIMKPFVCM